MSLSRFKEMLARRLGKAQIDKLAAQAGVGRSHLSQVLHNKPGRGGQTRKKLEKHLTAEEMAELGWAQAEHSHLYSHSQRITSVQTHVVVFGQNGEITGGLHES